MTWVQRTQAWPLANSACRLAFGQTESYSVQPWLPLAANSSVENNSGWTLENNSSIESNSGGTLENNSSVENNSDGTEPQTDMATL